jgi:hypothetical protein
MTIDHVSHPAPPRTGEPSPPLRRAAGVADRTLRVAIVGSGPRGISVLERLAARLAGQPLDQPVDVYLIDAVAVGCGRVWRVDQPDWFLMNTVCGEVTMYSGEPDAGPARAGAGPSLAQWWATRDPAGYPGPHGYAPRALYGAYLQAVVDSVEAALPSHVRLHRLDALVEDLEPLGDRYRLILSTGHWLQAHKVVLATGHAQTALDAQQARLAAFAAQRPTLRYLSGDSPAEMAIEAIPAGATVGMIGLGLSFYDLLAAFTVGRGGRFEETADGRLHYRPSGAEPRLVAGSRSGVLMLARGVNQKAPEQRYRPHLFTFENVTRHRAHGALEFRRDVLPWLLAEVELTYYGTALQQRGDTPRDLLDAALEDARWRVPDVAALARRQGLDDLPRLDLERLANPFAGRSFDSPDAFHAALSGLVRDDLAHAAGGNLGNPLKAALDVMRDVRGEIRRCVDFGGLTARSHRDEFLGWFVPLHGLLVAGPPLVRLRQALALIDAGLLRVLGPDARFDVDEPRDCFVLDSPRVAGARTEAHVLIDARVPQPDLHRDPAPLPRRMLERGLFSSFHNRNGDAPFDTGGIDVTLAPYHPRAANGTPNKGLYVHGIPAEHTRWFMQIGNGRPGAWGDFTRDADRIADHIASMRVVPE